MIETETELLDDYFDELGVDPDDGYAMPTSSFYHWTSGSSELRVAVGKLLLPDPISYSRAPFTDEEIKLLAQYCIQFLEYPGWRLPSCVRSDLTRWLKAARSRPEISRAIAKMIACGIDPL